MSYRGINFCDLGSESVCDSLLHLFRSHDFLTADWMTKASQLNNKDEFISDRRQKKINMAILRTTLIRSSRADVTYSVLQLSKIEESNTSRMEY
ncbi:hypothetical protein ANN_02018 [Periplaneta americana]|uniref:Uncharacterized protein n=1 Tax=Periplaneta americana TaxID=6978 RepID=A0ABQ8TW99_PERAM|nr:hypothetical protein ANN_02018 [Periplaneta americana]